MKINEKKVALLKELRDVNNEVFTKVHEGESFHDIIGNDFDHFWEALRYVPNHVIKKWIKEYNTNIENCKMFLENHGEKK